MKSFLDENLLFLGFHDIFRLENLADAVGFNMSPYRHKWLAHKINESTNLDFLVQLIKASEEFDDLRRALEHKIFDLNKENSINKRLEKINRKNGWSEEDVVYLSNCSIEDYKQWLCEENSILHELVNACLSMGEVTSKNLRIAIKELAKVSKLNAMRAKFLYKIDIESNDSDIDVKK